MLSCKAFFELLGKEEVAFFTGVPDSLLKDFCGYVADHADKHVIAANEGNAVGIAAGYHLASGKVPLVYMQNSGQGNAVNPLLSLADPKVYGIPMVLLVGWRGEPGVQDEPQHVKQGEVTEALFNAMGIAHAVLPNTEEDAADCVQKAVARARKDSAPFALLVQKGTFESYSGKSSAGSGTMTREDALRLIVDVIGVGVVVSTTGKTSREVYELREAKGQDHAHDFLTVGSMGHASSIALGIALEQKKPVYCLDGDGAFIMHMGSAAVIGAQSCSNFKHIVLNNGAHDSVGGQPTAGADVSLAAIAKECGYVAVFTADDEKSLKSALGELAESDGPSFLEIRVKKGARADLGRPTSTPADNKKAFMEFLQE